MCNIALKVALKQLKVKQPTSLHLLKNLVPFLDRDYQYVLCVKKRIDSAIDLSDEAKHPALLPKDHNVTKYSFKSTSKVGSSTCIISAFLLYFVTLAKKYGFFFRS